MKWKERIRNLDRKHRWTKKKKKKELGSHFICNKCLKESGSYLPIHPNQTIKLLDLLDNYIFMLVTVIVIFFWIFGFYKPVTVTCLISFPIIWKEKTEQPHQKGSSIFNILFFDQIRIRYRPPTQLPFLINSSCNVLDFLCSLSCTK